MIQASLVQFDAVPLDSSFNIKRMLEMIDEEASHGADLILFPELSNTGYVEPLIPGGSFISDVPHYGKSLYDACADPAGDEIASFIERAKRLGVHLVLGLGMRDDHCAGVMRNSSLYISPDGLLECYTKVHQWQNEKLYFTPGDRIESVAALGTRIGMQICYDIRFPEITRIYSLQGAGIITSVWAAFGPDDESVNDEGLFIHRTYTRAVENGVFLLSCNRSGLHGNQRFHGRSCAIAPNGNILGVLTHDNEDVLRVTLDLDDISRYRSEIGIWADRNPALYARYATVLHP